MISAAPGCVQSGPKSHRNSQEERNSRLSDLQSHTDGRTNRQTDGSAVGGSSTAVSSTGRLHRKQGPEGALTGALGVLQTLMSASQILAGMEPPAWTRPPLLHAYAFPATEGTGARRVGRSASANAAHPAQLLLPPPPPSSFLSFPC